jgi:hypothetical protein
MKEHDKEKSKIKRDYVYDNMQIRIWLVLDPQI